MIALITGATGDIGEEFVKGVIGEVDKIWAVGRSEEKLNALKEKFGGKIVPVRTDLSDREDILRLCSRIEEEKPQIRYLINNAGTGKMAPVSEFSYSEIAGLLEINMTATTLLCRAAIPYMEKGGYILNICSASAFQPNPYIALYSASKSYLLSFTRSLNVELSDVNCIAVCPGWVDTKMLSKMHDGKKVEYPGIVTAKKVVDDAIRDVKKGKDVSVCSPYYRFMRFYSKVMPHSIVMKQWLKGIRDYI